MNEETWTIEQMSPETNERIANAPNPSPATLRRRQNPFLQLFAFAGFNWRILRLVTIAKFGGHK
ncbi:hypothetical protein [Mobiluncus mulieris]|uniref:Uncharacterized protein n=1 Tax=Mobiluncus mulieris TaxID=2052 RepID=A0ABD4TYJ4_9ACTO|nr:hypothetical protein [Mobiluncus mulieris]MCU9968876.1 hypothetical protein [Mobiluncus mulieris]MCU9973047.1 hypothetical protein [Mobiluncus mulieris]MCU9996115.1 hypothetical protein [Mobiluncus mulieris]MCV0008623.1 hypothetical protein [Mobiluncus mulieris]MCV0013504.1 hypothetical protein [Mobiluncus mulieris]